jgi:hypothetical protein
LFYFRKTINLGELFLTLVHYSFPCWAKKSSSRLSHSSSENNDDDSFLGVDNDTRRTHSDDEVRTSNTHSQGNRQHKRDERRSTTSTRQTMSSGRVRDKTSSMRPSYESRSTSAPSNEEFDQQSVGASSSDSLAYVQLDAYNIDPKELVELHDTEKNNISRIVRSQIFPKVKFLNKSGKEHEKMFGSFWRPDLLVNTPPYIDAILDNFGDLKHRRDDESILTDAVQFWVMAAPTVRQVILDRRSNVTQRMKKELVIGMYYYGFLGDSLFRFSFI